MNRCALPTLWGLASLLVALTASAQTTRNFPATALRGSLVVTQPPEILLNGQPAFMSPGSRIRGENNLLQLSSTLVGQKLLVHYTLDPYGLVHDVWILTPAEAARRPWPATPAEAQAWQFDADAQTWTRR
jgi:hypothetical protein